MASRANSRNSQVSGSRSRAGSFQSGIRAEITVKGRGNLDDLGHSGSVQQEKPSRKPSNSFLPIETLPRNAKDATVQKKPPMPMSFYDGNKQTEFEVMKRSAAILTNDFIYLLNNKPGDVNFYVDEEDKQIGSAKDYEDPYESFYDEKKRLQKVKMTLHSVVLMARSKWFRKYLALDINREALVENRRRLPGEGDGKLFMVGNFVENKEYGLDKLDVIIYQTEEDFLQANWNFYISNINISAFKELTKYLYSSTCSINEKYAFDFFKASKILSIEALEEILAEFLMSKINENRLNEAVQLLILSDKSNSKILKKKCIKFLNKHGKCVVQTDCWKHLAQRMPRLVLEVFIKNTDLDNDDDDVVD